MSTQTYNALEGELSIRPAPTVARGGTSNAVALVGGYDAANADANVTAGKATIIDDPNNADKLFGNSELARAAPVVAANGVGTIYGVPVAETQTTESFTASQSLTLANDPIFDPSVHPDHVITVTDAQAGVDLSVNIVYDDPVPTPSKSDTANVNPVIGEVECDASSDYDVSYTYGNYAEAINTAASLGVRYVCPLTENDSVKADVVTELSDIAADFDFKRAVVGATPEIGVSDISNYTPGQENWRLVEVAPARASGADGAVRTAAAVCGLMAAQPIGPEGSTLFDTISGITSLNTEYRGTEAKNFKQVTSVTRTARIAQAVTTSASAQFQNVYATEIIDRVALDLFETAASYAGGPQDIGELQTLLEIVCDSASNGNPPLLGFGDDRDGNPYQIDASLGADPNVAKAAITIVPHPIAEQVNISITVSDGFVTFNGTQ